MANRFGTMRRVLGKDYRAFYPSPMPTSVNLSSDTVRVLANAEAALGRLAGAGRLLPNPHLLIRPYMLREALASTRIEGTRASLVGVLEAEAAGDTGDPDIEEVVNYVRAMELGIARIDALPFSTRLVNELHGVLLEGVRGRERQPGQIRTSQNWIGPPGAVINTASFIPPPPEELGALLSDWERFANTNTEIPILVQSALLHYQFETIHPFLDGNGRVGRLMIVLHLIIQGRLASPLLYLSPYFERHRDEYIDLLQTTRTSGDPDPWLRFYLSGIEQQAVDAVQRAEQLADLRERYRASVLERTRGNAVALVDILFAQPVLTARIVENHLDVRRPSVLRMLDLLTDMGILEELDPGPRGQRRFIAREIMAALSDDEGDST